MFAKFIVPVFMIAISSPLAATVVTVNPGDDLRAKVQSLNGAPGAVVVTPGTYNISDSIVLSSGQSIHGQYGQSIVRWTGPLARPMIRVLGTKGSVVGTMSANDAIQTPTISQSTPLGPVLISKVVNGVKQREDNVVVADAQGGRALLRRPVLLYPTGADLYQLTPADGVSLSGLTLDGAPAPNIALAAVELSLATNFRMQNCRIHRSDFGIWVKESFRITVEESRFESTWTAAFRVEGATVASFRGNSLLNAGRTGFSLLDGIWVCNVTNNEIVGTGVNGDGAPSGGDAMNISSGGQIMIYNNQIVGAGCYGIWIGGMVEGAVIVGNTIVGGITAGILLNNGTESVRENVIAANIIANNNGGSIGLVPGRAVVVTNNVLDITRGGGVSGGPPGVSGVPTAEVTLTENVATGQ